MVKKGVAGFTLIELLIVIAVIAVLSALVFVVLDPWARLQDGHNAQRWTDINAIADAIKLYQIDNRGEHIGTIGNLIVDLVYQIGTASSGCNDTCSNPTVTLHTSCVDLSTLVTGGYLANIPVDTHVFGSSASETRYYIIKHTRGQITVGSCSEELGSNSSIPEISVSR